MSGVLIIRDPDPVRRRQGIQAPESALRRLDLVVSSAEHGTIGIVWGMFPGAPMTRAPKERTGTLMRAGASLPPW